MKKNLTISSTFIMLLLGLTVNTFSQIKQGEISIGGNTDDGIQSIIQTKDKGYAFTGYTESYGAGISDVYTVKLDSNSNIQWTSVVGGASADEGFSIIQTRDSGYAVAGYTMSYGQSNRDVYLLRYNASGTLLWTRTFGGIRTDQANSLIETEDSGFAIAGNTNSYGAGGPDVYIIKTDANGHLVWTKTVGGTGDDEGNSIIQSKDGGYVVAGITTSHGAGGYDVYVVKLNSVGDLIWTKTIGGAGDDYGTSICKASDGGYAIGGYTNSYGAGNYDVYIIKLDSLGGLEWAHTFGGANSDQGFGIVQTPDHGYAVAGNTFSYNDVSSGDFYLVKTDSSGNLKWTGDYGGAFEDNAYSLALTKDSGFVIGGTSISYSSGGYDGWIVRTDSMGVTCTPYGIGGTQSSGGTVDTGGTASTGGIEDSGSAVTHGGLYFSLCSVVTETKPIITSFQNINVYPNPSSNLIHIDFQGYDLKSSLYLKLTDVTGREIMQKQYSSKSQDFSTEMDISNFADGMYFIRLESGGKELNAKFIKQ